MNHNQPAPYFGEVETTMRTLAVTLLVVGLAAPAAAQDMGARSGTQDAGMQQGKTSSRRAPDPRMTESRNQRTPGSAGSGNAGSTGRADPSRAPSPGPADPSHNGVPSQTEKAKDARRPADSQSR